MHIDYKLIRGRAAWLRRLHDTSDPFRLAHRMGLKILYEDLGDGEDAVKGFFFQDKRIKTITLNSRISEHLRGLILAHEIGHAVLHHASEVNTFTEIGAWSDTNRFEIEANVFAAELMITDNEFFEAVGDFDFGYESLARSLGVMPELLDYKLRSMRGRGIEGIEQVQYAQTGFWRLYNDADDDVYRT